MASCIVPDGITGSTSEGDYCGHVSPIGLTCLFKVLPQSISVSLELAYPSRQTQRNFSIGRRLDLNVFVDSVLRTIYHVFPVPDAPFGRRRIMFTSFSPDVCSVLNWKQPNCQSFLVFFGRFC